MTAILSAGLVLAWIAIALLALGYAGLLAKLRDMQGQVAKPGAGQVNPELAASGPGRRTFVLALSSTCQTCEQVFARWPEQVTRLSAAGHRSVVVSMDGSRVWEERGAAHVIHAEELSSPFLIAYQPALLVFDERGALLSADPIGSAQSLHDTCQAYLELSEASL